MSTNEVNAIPGLPAKPAAPAAWPTQKWEAPVRANEPPKVDTMRRLFRMLADVGDLSRKVKPTPAIALAIKEALAASPDLRGHLFYSLADEEQDGVKECEPDVFVAALLANWLNANQSVLRVLGLDRESRQRSAAPNSIPTDGDWDLCLEPPAALGGWPTIRLATTEAPR